MMHAAHRPARHRDAVFLERAVRGVDARQLDLLVHRKLGKNAWDGARQQALSLAWWTDQQEIVPTRCGKNRGALGALLPANRGEIQRLGDQRFELQRLPEDISKLPATQKEVHHL